MCEAFRAPCLGMQLHATSLHPMVQPPCLRSIPRCLDLSTHAPPRPGALSMLWRHSPLPVGSQLPACPAQPRRPRPAVSQRTNNCIHRLISTPPTHPKPFNHLTLLVNDQDSSIPVGCAEAPPPRPGPLVLYCKPVASNCWQSSSSGKRIEIEQKRFADALALCGGGGALLRWRRRQHVQCGLLLLNCKANQLQHCEPQQ